MKNHIVVFLFIWAILASLASCTEETDPQIRLTAINSMERAWPAQVLLGKPSVDIKSAKNEYEAFQVIISAGAKTHLKNIKIVISDFKGEEGTIGTEHITMFRAENVFIRHSSPRAECPPGLYPDPLIPFINPVTGDSIKAGKKLKAPLGDPLRTPLYTAYPVDLYPGQQSTLWIDVYVPSNATAGEYNSSIKVLADGNINASIPIKLKVWNFTLPEVATHSSHLGHFSLISKMWGIDAHSEQYKATEMLFCEELARHRVNPPIPHSLLPEVNEDGSITIDPDRHEQLKNYIERTHLVDFEVPRTPFMSNTSNSDRPTPANQTDPVAIEKTKRYYQEMYQYIKENGWEKRAYVYLIDEPNSVKDYNQVINLAKVAEEAAPELKRLVVEQTYKHEPSWPDLDESIDVWCALFGFVDRETIQEKIKNGDEVWSYSALVQPAPPYHPLYEQVKGKNPPYWHIDQPALSYRVPTWLNRQYDITGLLYWTTAGWYNNSGPYVDPAMGPLPRTFEDSTNYLLRYYNGGGMLFYPGNDAGFDGPVTSIRMKNIREGLEDYEYFAILDQMGEGDFVKSMVDQVCPEWWGFTRDSEKILQVREQLAQKIESLTK